VNLGRVALTMAIVTVAFGAIQLLASPFLFTVGNLPAYVYGMISGGATVVHTLLSAATLVVGVIAARRGEPLFGGIAIGVGGAGAIAGLLGLIGFPLLSLLLNV
jgi:hypothetical protein